MTIIIISITKVDRHCNRLDADLVKLEEEHPIGNLRITTYPGLEPSSRNLREGIELREKSSKRLERERKELKVEKKGKCIYIKIYKYIPRQSILTFIYL